MNAIYRLIIPVLLAGILTACQTAEVAPVAAPPAKPVAAAAAPAPVRPAAPGVVWGEPVNGLCAGVELVPNQGEYKAGEHVQVRFHLKNVGQKRITLASKKVRQDFAIAQTPAGAPLGVYTEKFVGRNELQQISLEPGGTATIAANRLGFGEVDRLIVQRTTGERMGSMIHVGGGDCKVHYRLKFPDFFKHANDKDVTSSSDWQGEIDTGACPVHITN